MVLVFEIAALFTLAFIGLAVLTLTTGVIMFYLPRQRSIAPFVLLVPTLAALGAAGAPWGLFFLAHKFFEPRFAGAQYVGWLLGLPAGASLGLVLGLGLAFWIRRSFIIRHDNAA